MVQLPGGIHSPRLDVLYCLMCSLALKCDSSSEVCLCTWAFSSSLGSVIITEVLKSGSDLAGAIVHPHSCFRLLSFLLSNFLNLFDRTKTASTLAIVQVCWPDLVMSRLLMSRVTCCRPLAAVDIDGQVPLMCQLMGKSDFRRGEQ